MQKEIVLCGCGCGERVKTKGRGFCAGHAGRVLQKEKYHERTWHKKAKEKFGKNSCEICGISTEESKIQYGQYLAMHCLGGTSNYHVMEDSNWQTVCHRCHSTMEFHNASEETHEKRKNGALEYAKNHIVSTETRRKLSSANFKRWSSQEARDSLSRKMMGNQNALSRNKK